MNTYDYLYTGTGPISVIDGIIQAKNKHTVLFVDDRTRIGGAWGAIPVGNYGELEIGCHIWSYNKLSYSFLHSFLGLELVALDPQPILLKGNLSVPYDRKNLVLTLKQSVKYLIRLQLRNLYRYFKDNPSARLNLFSRKYNYPKGGGRAIQQALEKKIKASAIDCLLNTKIKALEKKNDYWLVTKEDNTQITTRFIKLTSTSTIQTITKGEHVINVRFTTVNYIHFHLVFDEVLHKSFSYLRLVKHPLIHRISDITDQLTTNPKGHTVLLVGVLSDKIEAYKSDQQVINVVLEFLRNKQFITTNCKLLYHQKNEFETKYIVPAQINQIKSLDDQLELLHTTDLMYGVYYRLNEWKKALL